MKDLWWQSSLEERLANALNAYIKLELYSTFKTHGSGSAFMVDALERIMSVLSELREIMIADDPFDTLTEEAVREIRKWIRSTKKGSSYDLLKALREIRQFDKNVGQT